MQRRDLAWFHPIRGPLPAVLTAGLLVSAAACQGTIGNTSASGKRGPDAGNSAPTGGTTQTGAASGGRTGGTPAATGSGGSASGTGGAASGGSGTGTDSGGTGTGGTDPGTGGSSVAFAPTPGAYRRLTGLRFA